MNCKLSRNACELTISDQMFTSRVLSPPPSLPCISTLNPKKRRGPSLDSGIKFISLHPFQTSHLASRLPARKPFFSSPPASSPSSDYGKQLEEEEEYQVLTCVKSLYNDIVIVDTPKARMLLLDSTGNVHSVLKKGEKWTGSYWDEFASLPAIIPEGPIAIFGLGGGTAAHLLLDLWPSLQLEGWEIDEILIDKAREYFGLLDLERDNQAGGRLHIHIGDALSPSGNDCQRYAGPTTQLLETAAYILQRTVPLLGHANKGSLGIIVDLFSEGNVLEQLQKVETWLLLKDQLVANGRLMVNCGGVTPETESVDGAVSTVDAWHRNSVMKTLYEAFSGELIWKKMPEPQGANYLALTGPHPDLSTWSAVLPPYLSGSVYQWRPCDPRS